MSDYRDAHKQAAWAAAAAAQELAGLVAQAIENRQEVEGMVASAVGASQMPSALRAAGTIAEAGRVLEEAANLLAVTEDEMHRYADGF